MDPNQEYIDYAKGYVPVLFSKNVSDGAYRLWEWYKFRGNSLGVVWWKYREVAEQFGISERTVRRRVRELERVGLMRVNRDDRKGHEVSIMPFSSEVLTALDAPLKWSQVRGGSPVLNRYNPGTNLSQDGPERQICPRSAADLSYPVQSVNKTINKTTFSGQAGEERTPFDEIFQDPLVVKSTEPSAPTRSRRPRKSATPERESIDDFTLARWNADKWARTFCAAMNAAGVRIDRSNMMNVVRPQMSNILAFLLEKLGRVKSHQFLMHWFPDNLTHLAEGVFRKEMKHLSPISLNLISCHLGELVDRYEDHERAQIKFTDTGAFQYLD